MDLNYFGLLHVIKTFMPLLKEYSMPIQQGSRGKKPTQNSRFIAVTSTIAVMPSFPGLSGYAASKSAADTLMNCLRVEVKPFAIDVITVCPGITRTPFLSKGADQMRCAWESAPQHIKKDYGDVYATWLPSAVQFGIDWLAHDVGDGGVSRGREHGGVAEDPVLLWDRRKNTRKAVGSRARFRLGRGPLDSEHDTGSAASAASSIVMMSFLVGA